MSDTAIFEPPLVHLFLGPSEWLSCLVVGCDEGIAVSDDYTAPFAFQGTLGEVVVEMPERSPGEAKQAARTDVFADLARQ